MAATEHNSTTTIECSEILVDGVNEYALIHAEKTTEAHQQEPFLPAGCTVPGATWDVARRIRGLIAHELMQGNFRRVALCNGQDATRWSDRLSKLYAELAILDGETSAMIAEVQSGIAFQELLTNGVRRRDPATGLAIRFNADGSERQGDDQLPEAEHWQEAHVSYGLEETSDGRTFFVVHIFDEAHGYEYHSRGFNPFRIPNPLNAEAGLSMTCRRGVLMIRSLVANLGGTCFYLPLEPEMTPDTFRSNEPFMRLLLKGSPDALRQKFESVSMEIHTNSAPPLEETVEGI